MAGAMAHKMMVCLRVTSRYAFYLDTEPRRNESNTFSSAGRPSTTIIPRSR
jgi:hypothetical protein